MARQTVSHPLVPWTHGYPDGTYRVVESIWWLTGFVNTLLAIRFLLKLFGANPVPFVRFVYDLTWPLIVPFHGIFNTDQVGVSVLEPENLVAIAIYTLLAWGIVSLIHVLTHPPSVVV
jgi:hypothetical protein